MAGGLRVIEQKISAGSDFDGTLPTTIPVPGDGIDKNFPIDTVGGLFDFSIKSPVWLRSIELILGGQSLFTVHKKDLGGKELLYVCGTSEGFFVTTESDSITLTDGQTLVLRTTGATGELLARMTIQVIK